MTVAAAEVDWPEILDDVKKHPEEVVMILADTHVWLWWISDTTRLSTTAREALGCGPVGVSPLTFREMAMLAYQRLVAPLFGELY